MPELPEVENVIRSMSLRLAGRKAVRVVYAAPHLHVLPFGTDLTGCWTGKTVTDLKRHGKYIQLLFSDDSAFIIHLRMTGKFFFEDGPVHEKHNHFILELDSGLFLHFSDVRKFARFVYASAGTDLTGFLPAGPDALTVPDSYLKDSAARWPQAKLKAFLLDQNRIAGIGNIYADEICHAGGWLPDRELGTVPPDKLGPVIRGMLADAIRLKGTTLRDYSDAEGRKGSFQLTLKVYGRDNCGTCGGNTVRIKIAGRTTRFCPHCQS